MFIRDLNQCEEFAAGDNTLLRELLHPAKADLKLRYSLAHRLRTSEVYYILEGEATMHINDESAPVRPGHAIYIPPNAKQHIHNTGNTDLVFLCIVDPAWRKEDEEVF
jgi:mannose-6-phosphate isomerase-like protein (cupin superfamily)